MFKCVGFVRETEVQTDPGEWEENFKSHHDNKPRGPSAIGNFKIFSEVIV